MFEPVLAEESSMSGVFCSGSDRRAHEPAPWFLDGGSVKVAFILAAALTTPSVSYPAPTAAPKCSAFFDGVIDNTIRASILIGRAREAYDLHRMDRYTSYSEQVGDARSHLNEAIKTYSECERPD
jgi:hypothetical protein